MSDTEDAHTHHLDDGHGSVVGDGGIAVAGAPAPPSASDAAAAESDQRQQQASASPLSPVGSEGDGMGEVGLGASPLPLSAGDAAPSIPLVAAASPVGAAGAATGGTPTASSATPAAASISASLPSTPTPFELLYTSASSDTSLGSDYARVAHSWASVAGQLATGLDSLRNVAEFVRRVAAAKQDYAAQLLKTSSAYASRNGGNSSGPSQPQQQQQHADNKEQEQQQQEKDVGRAASVSSPPAVSIAGVSQAFSNMVSAAKSASTSAAASVSAAVSDVSGSAGGAFGSDGDAMGSAARVWSELREHLFDEARSEQEYSAKISAEVVAPMMSFHADASRKLKVLNSHQAALSGQMRAITEGALLQAKIAAVKAVAALQAQEARERDAVARAAAAASAAGGATNNEPVPPPPVHLKSFEAEGGLSSKTGSAATGDSGNNKSAASTTKRAMASVSGWFKNLGKKADQKEAAHATEATASNAAAGVAAGSDAAEANVPSVSSASGAAAPSSLAGAVGGAVVGAGGAGSGESSEELRERAYQLCLAFELALSASNARQTQFFSRDLPSLFAEAQRLEVARLECLKHYISVLAAASRSMNGPAAQRAASLAHSVAAMDARTDTRLFADAIVSQVGQVVQPNPYVYDLQYSADEVRAARMDNNQGAVQVPVAQPAAAGAGAGSVKSDDAGAAAASAPSSAPSSSARPPVFGSSLSVQMDLADADAAVAAKSADPSSAGAVSELDVPPALHALVAAIRARRGWNKLNLLSGSAPGEQVASLRARFESGDFSPAATVGVSLEVLAATLKAWLRALPEPLCPAPLYSAAIQAIKKDAASALADRHAQAEAVAAALTAAKATKEASSNAAAAAGSIIMSPALDGSGGGSQVPVQSLDGIDRPPNAAAAAAVVAPSSPAAAAGALSPSASAAAAATPPPASPRSAGSAPMVLPPANLSFLPSVQLASYCSSIFSALPTLNQRVIATLAALVNDLATAGSQLAVPPTKGAATAAAAGAGASGEDSGHPHPSVVTDWQRWASLCSTASLCFVPSFLRLARLDAVEKSAHAKLEARFVAALLMTVSQASQQQLDQAAAAAASGNNKPAFAAQFSPPASQHSALPSASSLVGSAVPGEPSAAGSGVAGAAAGGDAPDAGEEAAAEG